MFTMWGIACSTCACVGRTYVLWHVVYTLFILRQALLIPSEISLGEAEKFFEPHTQACNHCWLTCSSGWSECVGCWFVNCYPSGGVPSPVSCNPYLVCPPQELLHFSHSVVNASTVIEMWCGPCNVWLFTGMSAYIEVKVGCVCAYTHTWLWLAQLYQSEQLATSTVVMVTWMCVQ